MRAEQSGFTYVLMLVAVAVVAIMAGVAGEFTSERLRADREAELLFRGQAYRDAIASYYRSGVIKQFPPNLEDLLNDPRFANKRHLRALYTDPITGGDWLLVKSVEGGISGVASGSPDAPRKRANFPRGLEEFEEAQRYSDWVFEYRPKAVGATDAGPAGAGSR